MPTFQIHFRSAADPVTLEAEDVEVSDTAIVFTASVSVMNRPRTVVVRRVPAGEVLRVDEVRP